MLIQRFFMPRAMMQVALVAMLASLLARPCPAQQEPARVTVGTISEQTLAASQTFVGSVTPIRTSVVGSAVDGRVVQFLVNEGTQKDVEPGQNVRLTRGVAVDFGVLKGIID